MEEGRRGDEIAGIGGDENGEERGKGEESGRQSVNYGGWGERLGWDDKIPEEMEMDIHS